MAFTQELEEFRDEYRAQFDQWLSLVKKILKESKVSGNIRLCLIFLKSEFENGNYKISGFGNAVRDIIAIFSSSEEFRNEVSAEFFPVLQEAMKQALETILEREPDIEFEDWNGLDRYQRKIRDPIDLIDPRSNKK